MAGDDEVRFRGPSDDDTQGWTLLEGWRANTHLSGAPEVCLLAAGGPPVTTDEIPRVVVLARDEMVATIARILAETPDWPGQTLVYDGEIGHAILLREADEVSRTITFWDPEPSVSLLKDAQPAEQGRLGRGEQEGLWRIDFQDLARVLVCTFLAPARWALIVGEPPGLAYSSVQKSDFWAYLDLSEGERRGAGAETYIDLVPGAFGGHIAMKATIKNGLVERAALELRRSWALDPQRGANPLALDVAGRFVGTFASVVDAETSATIEQTLKEAWDPQRTMPRLQNGEFMAGPAGQVLRAFVDDEPRAHLMLKRTGVGVELIDRSGAPWIRLRIAEY